MADREVSAVSFSDFDMEDLIRIADSHNISLYELGRALSQQARGSRARWIRLSDHEHSALAYNVKKHGATITHWCAMACSAFLRTWDGRLGIIDNVRSRNGLRKKRIRVVLQNQEQDAEICAIASRYSVGVSSLLRHCLLTYNGEGGDWNERKL